MPSSWPPIHSPSYRSPEAHCVEVHQRLACKKAWVSMQGTALGKCQCKVQYSVNACDTECSGNVWLDGRPYLEGSLAVHGSVDPLPVILWARCPHIPARAMRLAPRPHALSDMQCAVSPQKERDSTTIPPSAAQDGHNSTHHKSMYAYQPLQAMCNSSTHPQPILKPW